jgi:hypothetical protein
MTLLSLKVKSPGIVLRPGPTRQVDMGPVRVEAKTRLEVGPAKPGRLGTRLIWVNPAETRFSIIYIYIKVTRCRFD